MFLFAARAELDCVKAVLHSVISLPPMRNLVKKIIFFIQLINFFGGEIKTLIHSIAYKSTNASHFMTYIKLLAIATVKGLG